MNFRLIIHSKFVCLSHIARSYEYITLTTYYRVLRDHELMPNIAGCPLGPYMLQDLQSSLSKLIISIQADS
jgi:hypothetical protein